MMIEGIVWQLVSMAVFIPAFLGLYLLVAPSDQLVVQYQNYYLRRSSKPLKDEDFGNMPKVIFALKVLGGTLFCVSMSLLFLILR